MNPLLPLIDNNSLGSETLRTTISSLTEFLLTWSHADSHSFHELKGTDTLGKQCSEAIIYYIFHISLTFLSAVIPELKCEKYIYVQFKVEHSMICIFLIVIVYINSHLYTTASLMKLESCTNL